MKRFYTLVLHEKSADGYQILLDGKAVKTKDGQNLVAPNEHIASSVVQEWSNQGDTIEPDTMPFTQILSTKIDRVRHQRNEMTDMLLKYLDTDLICYLASEPDELVKRQNELWSPVRGWFQKDFGTEGHPLKTTTGLAALSQDEIYAKNVRSYIQSLDNDHFTFLQIIIASAGSLILGLAFICGFADEEHVLNACFVEEDFKDTLYDIETYGADPYIEAKQAALRSDLKHCNAFRNQL